jgi:hypothetical protein
MHRAGQKPETVSKKKSDFFLMGEYFFLTYFLIGEPEARAGLNPPLQKEKAAGMPVLIEMLLSSL